MAAANASARGQRAAILASPLHELTGFYLAVDPATQMGARAGIPADQGTLGVPQQPHHIAVRFQYEFHDDSGNWFRAHGNEQWEFDDAGLMRRREASINDVPIAAADRRFLWQPLGPRPTDHPGLSELGL